MTSDPFAVSESTPAVSFKDAPVGASVTGRVVEAPSMVQKRNYESGEPDFWPDGNPKWTVVTVIEITDTSALAPSAAEIGTKRSVWADKPSALYRAFADAQRDAGEPIKVGGELTVTFTGEKPNEKNPRLNPQKLYAVRYSPPDAFATGSPTVAASAPARAAAPSSSAPAAPQLDAASIAALKAAGFPLDSIGVRADDVPPF